MNLKVTLLTLFLMLFNCLNSRGQDHILKLWPDKIPGAVSSNRTNRVVEPTGAGCIDGINDPELEVFLPAPEKATGAAVLVIPGGGYSVVCLRKEGYDIAEWLAEQGIAGIVLKYRLPSDEMMLDKSMAPLQDAQKGMRLIRENAVKWNIDPEKIGVMGFSAGGHLASTLSTHFDEKVYEHPGELKARPAFSILIYPVISMDTSITHMGSRNKLLGTKPAPAKVQHLSNELQVNRETPPTFLVHATDDTVVPVGNSLRYYEALAKHDVPAEMHIYQKGGHGFALGRQGTERSWPEALLSWLKNGGWL